MRKFEVGERVVIRKILGNWAMLVGKVTHTDESCVPYKVKFYDYINGVERENWFQEDDLEKVSFGIDYSETAQGQMEKKQREMLITFNRKIEFVDSTNGKLPKNYIINKGATILFWQDGTKTIVKKSKDDKYDKEKGFLVAFFQKYSGMSRNKANKYLKNLKEETKQKFTNNKKKKEK